MTDYKKDFYRDAGAMDLFTAVSLGFTSTVISTKIEDLDMRNLEGWTLLMYACWGGYEKIVEHLLKVGCSPNVEGPEKDTPLMLAVSNGNMNIVKAVFVQEKLHATNKIGWSALFFAVFYGRLTCAEFLLSKGANPHAVDCMGQSPIHLALKSGIESLSALLLRGTEIEIKPATDQANTNPMGPVIYQQNINSPKKKTSIFRKIRTYTLQTRQGGNKENEYDIGGADIPQSPLLQNFPPKSPVLSNSGKSPLPLRFSPRPAFKKTPKKTPDKRKQTVEGFLKELELEKYWPIFRDEEVDFETLLTFDDTNLKEIGISLYGPRRKILMAIQEYGAIHGTGIQLLKNHFWTR